MHIGSIVHYVDSYDSSNNGALIGAIVIADCTVIIIMVITNIMVWIYCFRKRQHTGIYVATVHGHSTVHGRKFWQGKIGEFGKSLAIRQNFLCQYSQIH